MSSKEELLNSLETAEANEELFKKIYGYALDDSNFLKLVDKQLTSTGRSEVIQQFLAWFRAEKAKEAAEQKEIATWYNNQRKREEKKSGHQVILDNGKFQVLNTPKEFDTISARALMDLDIPPVEFIVDNFLPLGLAVLGAPPKSFKSFMCLDMALCVCRGFDFLGFKTKKCSVLYLDLESTKRRPRARIRQILKGDEVPDNLYIATEAALMGKGFEEQLHAEKEKHPDLGLVVVDVMGKVRPPATKSVDPYERDYADYGKMKMLADELNITILLVTHTTKMKHPEDPFNELTGSSGVMGSLDVALVIKKDKREDQTAKLYITGRDLEEQCYEIQFSKSECRWKKLGTQKDMEQLRKELEYKTSPIVMTIKKLLQQNNGQWSGSASDIIKASQFFKDCTIYDNDKQVGKKIHEYNKMMGDVDGIEFHEKPRTGKGRSYEFLSKEPFSEEYAEYVQGEFNDIDVTYDTDVIHDIHDINE